MLEASKSRWFESVFSIYNRNLLRRRFSSLSVKGTALEDKQDGIPLITIANHSSWWDGLVLFEVFRHFKLDSYVMMEEKQLARLRPFRWLGAFSVNRENPASAAQSVRYAVRLITENPNANLLIFPQGEIQPSEKRPFEFERGFGTIIEKSRPCKIVQIGIRYEFLGEYKPAIFVAIGNSRTHNGLTNDTSLTALTCEFEKELTELVDGIKDDVVAGKFDLYEDVI